jgi:hypothetical protein
MYKCEHAWDKERDLNILNKLGPDAFALAWLFNQDTPFTYTNTRTHTRVNIHNNVENVHKDNDEKHKHTHD